MLWDMDGVLTDTGGFDYQAWSQVLAAYDLPTPVAAVQVGKPVCPCESPATSHNLATSSDAVPALAVVLQPV
ncbi:MAG: hypothetical protein Kow0063_16650 [Anaerolineae bacterium]